MSDLVERLTKRAKEDRQCAANSAIIADLLEPQMALFRASNPDAPWNTYTVRMAVDHANSVKRDTQYAIDLEVAAAELSRLSARVEELERAAEATDAIARSHEGLPPPRYFGDTSFQMRLPNDTPCVVQVGRAGDYNLTLADFRRLATAAKEG